MTHENTRENAAALNRRDFLHHTAGALGATAAAASIARVAHAQGSDVIKVGLVGCGGRGTGAAVQALAADSSSRLVSMGDMFADQLERSLTNISRTEVKQQIAVSKEKQYVGFDAYKGVIADSDVVLLATPPHFRPMHLRAAIEAGKHVFAEKPVAVDAWGVRDVLETTEMAAKRGLSIVSGLCWRYDSSMRETIGRVHAGQIGDVAALESTRFTGIVGRSQDRTPEMTDMEYQLRNWYYYTWLSGDFIVEQFVHELDKMAWVMRDVYPVSVTCAGGRQTRSGPNSGHIYDHFSAIFDYEDGTRYYAATRHQGGCSNMNRDMVHGTKGKGDLMKFTLTGANPWKGDKSKIPMHQAEHNEMFAAIRAGKAINNGRYMALSTLMAIAARESAYTGKTITWEQAMKSQQQLKPSAYTRDGAPPPADIAMPGYTKFV